MKPRLYSDYTAVLCSTFVHAGGERGVFQQHKVTLKESEVPQTVTVITWSVCMKLSHRNLKLTKTKQTHSEVLHYSHVLLSLYVGENNKQTMLLCVGSADVDHRSETWRWTIGWLGHGVNTCSSQSAESMLHTCRRAGCSFHHSATYWTEWLLKHTTVLGFSVCLSVCLSLWLCVHLSVTLSFALYYSLYSPIFVLPRKSEERSHFTSSALFLSISAVPHDVLRAPQERKDSSSLNFQLMHRFFTFLPL